MKNKSCIICGHETTSFKHPRFDIVFHECDFCEFIFKDEKNHITHDEELMVYDLHQNSIENIGYVNYLNNFIDTAVTPFIQMGKVLDFGSGPNPVLKQLLSKSFSFDVDIYDFFYSPLKVYENQKYDLITSTEVVEHFQDPLSYFKLFYELLSPNGILSIMTLFHPKTHQEIFDWFYIRDKSHVSFFTIKTMQYIADTLGFNLIYDNDYRVVVFKKD